jgi:hypothetical protein
MSSPATLRKPLGVRATPEQHRLLTEAAAREHRSVSSFVLRAAIQAAEAHAQTNGPEQPKRSREEIKAIFEAARAAVREANPDNRDILAEFLTERREAGARGE